MEAYSKLVTWATQGIEPDSWMVNEEWCHAFVPLLVPSMHRSPSARVFLQSIEGACASVLVYRGGGNAKKYATVPYGPINASESGMRYRCKCAHIKAGIQLNLPR